MNKKEMIDKIYEVVADKTLSFGCKVKKDRQLFEYVKLDTFIDLAFESFVHIDQSRLIYNGYTIIGHPVMVNIILHWVDKNKSGPDREEYIIPICDLYVDKDKPIEEQHEKCITYIYDLITK